MADVDPLTLFQTAPASSVPPPSTSTSGEVDPLSLFRTDTPTTTASAPRDLPVVSEYGDLANQDWAKGAQPAPGTVAPVVKILDAALEGAKKGYGSPSTAPSPILTPEAQAALDKAQVAGGITGKLAQLGSTAAGDVGKGINYLSSAGGALFGAYQGGVAQAGIEAGAPLLGRDLAALPEAFPSGDTGGGTHLPAPTPGATRPKDPLYVPSDLRAPPDVTGNALSNGAPAPASINPHVLTPEQLAPTPGPNLLASSAPRSAAPIPNGLTPAQIAEFKNIPDDLPPTNGPIKTQADADARADQILQYFASIGNTTPISGATGALPTITGNSGLATLYRAVRDSDTPVPFTTLENASKTDALGQLKTMTGTPDDLAGAITTRATTTKPMYDAAWANKGEADPSAAIQTVQDFMKSPAKQNDTVMAELPSILKKLQGETDPEQLKGISDNIDATMDRLNTEGKADRETKRVMATVKDSITPAISEAAPGFDAAQAEYAKQSRGIDQMKYLQGRKLTDLQGNPTLGNMRSTLDDIQKKQAGDKFNPADSVTPENIQILQKLHDQMQREQLTQTAGKALGSNTFQNLATNSTVGSLAGHLGNGLAGGLVGGGVDLATGGHGFTGMLAGNALSNAAKYFAQTRATAASAQAAAGHKMLMSSLRDRLLNIDNKGVQSLSGGSTP